MRQWVNFWQVNINAGDSLIFSFSNINPKIKIKINAESHFNIVFTATLVGPPNQTPGENDTQTRKATRGCRHLHAKPLYALKKAETFR